MTQIERDILTTGAGKPDQDWQISPGKRGILAIPLLSAPRQDTNSLGALARAIGLQRPRFPVPLEHCG